VAVVASSPQPSDIQKNGSEQTPPANYQNPTSPNRSAITKPSGQKRKQENYRERPRENKVLAWSERYKSLIDIITTIAVAAFTGVLTMFTVKLWKSGEKHSERELRAYVFVSEVSTRNFMPNARPETEALIKNSGQTPAYKLKIERSFDIHTLPRTEFRHV